MVSLPIGKSKLKIGMRVKGKDYCGNDYTGTIVFIKGNKATVSRDDGGVGGGKIIDESPYFGERGWAIEYDRINKHWGSDEASHLLYNIEVKSWKDIIGNKK